MRQGRPRALWAAWRYGHPARSAAEVTVLHRPNERHARMTREFPPWLCLHRRVPGGAPDAQRRYAIQPAESAVEIRKISETNIVRNRIHGAGGERRLR